MYDGGRSPGTGRRADAAGSRWRLCQFRATSRTLSRPRYQFFVSDGAESGVAEELAQEVFFRVYRSRATYEPTAKFTTWLFRIATHLALNWIRDGKREQGHESIDQGPVDESASRQFSDGSPSVEQKLVLQARLAEVRAAVETLPDKQKAAVLMHKYQEMEYTQIATVLSCSESAVKSLLFRAYETLRSRLAHMA